jgi:hypothetical protein
MIRSKRLTLNGRPECSPQPGCRSAPAPPVHTGAQTLARTQTHARTFTHTRTHARTRARHPAMRLSLTVASTLHHCTTAPPGRALGMPAGKVANSQRKCEQPSNGHLWHSVGVSLRLILSCFLERPGWVRDITGCCGGVLFFFCFLLCCTVASMYMRTLSLLCCTVRPQCTCAPSHCSAVRHALNLHAHPLIALLYGTPSMYMRALSLLCCTVRPQSTCAPSHY